MWILMLFTSDRFHTIHMHTVFWTWAFSGYRVFPSIPAVILRKINFTFSFFFSFISMTLLAHLFWLYCFLFVRSVLPTLFLKSNIFRLDLLERAYELMDNLNNFWAETIKFQNMWTNPATECPEVKESQWKSITKKNNVFNVFHLAKVKRIVVNSRLI